MVDILHAANNSNIKYWQFLTQQIFAEKIEVWNMPFFDNFNGIFLNTTGNGEKFLEPWLQPRHVNAGFVFVQGVL